MNFLTEALISALIVIGGSFALIGSYGLLKLRELMARLHGPTKATTLGVGAILIASMAYFAIFAGTISIHELLVTLFLFVTAPVSANFIAKSFMHRHITPSSLPVAGRQDGWATYEAPVVDRQAASGDV